jgi:polynucleotide 5'-kinase involved in rRNA processing
MSYITREQAVGLASNIDSDGLRSALPSELETLCNAAIQHYIDSAIIELARLTTPSNFTDWYNSLADKEPSYQQAFEAGQRAQPAEPVEPKPRVLVGTIGHVDSGKTTLTAAFAAILTANAKAGS